MTDPVPPIENPGPVLASRYDPVLAALDPEILGPLRGSLLPCGCHVRRPDYQTVLCETHLAELNAPLPEQEHRDA